MQLVLIAFVVVLLLEGMDGGSDPAATDAGGDDLSDDVLSSIVRGDAVTHASYGRDGVVRVSPQDLADQAGVDLETYALARAIASEEPKSGNVTKAAVGWCMVNEAARRGQSVSELVLHAVNPAHSGFFGTQQDLEYKAATGTAKSDRYCSTALDPHAGELAIASGIYDGSIPDITGGCQQFDRPAGEANPERVAATRIKAGAVLVQVDGASSGLRFWRT